MAILTTLLLLTATSSPQSAGQAKSSSQTKTSSQTKAAGQSKGAGQTKAGNPVGSPQASNVAVEVPFKIGETAIIVDATVNGKTVSLMFDTGFSGAVTVDNTINLGKPTGSITLRDFVRTSEAPTVKITSLKLGSKTIAPKDMAAVLTPPSDSSFSYGTHCDGLMGFEVIKDYVTEINFEKNKFIFHPDSVDISTRVPDNKRTFLAKLLPTGHSSLEMWVTVPNGKTLTMALDTGNSFYATTHTDSLQRVGMWDLSKPKYTTLSGVASGTVESWQIRMPKVDIYGIPVENCYFDVIDLPSSAAEADGTIGFGFLKNFNLIIDYKRRRVWMENFTGKVANDVKGEIGLSAGYADSRKKVVVYRVSPQTPADEAGLKDGDELLSVDGVELTRQNYRQMRQMLEGEIGSTVKIAASRNGQLKRYQITRKALFNEPITGK